MTTDIQELLHLPVLPLKNTVLFPYLLLPLSAGRAGSVAAVEAALATEDKSILIIAQRDADKDEPAQDDLFTIGTRAVIKKMNRTEQGLEMIVQGVERMVVVRVEQTKPYVKAVVRKHPLPDDKGTEVEALDRK